jgi:ketosteroid isomerase-like protein
MNIPAARALAILLLLIPLVARTEEPTSSSASVEELMQLEKVWNEAHLKADVETLEWLWSDNLQVIVPKMPVMTKADVVGFVRSGRMKFEKYVTNNINVRFFGDSAVVTGHMSRSRTLNGQSVDDDWQFTKVYVRKGRGWQVVIFHASDAPVI